MSNFCPLPFGHTTLLTNGDFGVCCHHKHPKEYVVNINRNSFNDWHNSSYINEVRDSFKNNQRHPGCSACWKAEDSGQKSVRQNQLQEYKILKVAEPVALDTPVNIEIQLGNLCNLKCLMCNETESSAILAENKLLKINQHEQKDFTWNQTAFDHLSDLLSTGPKIINIRGGEPFYNKDLFRVIENLDSQVCSRTMLHITTNATQWDSKWDHNLSKFKLVRLMISLDAVDNLYEYIRYPAQWNTIESNIFKIQQVKNFKVLVHSVIQNLNILQIGNLVSWAQKHNLYLDLAQLYKPDYLSITNLPIELKKQAIEHLTQVLTTHIDQHISNFLSACKTQLLNSLNEPFNEVLWKKFQVEVGQRDQLRGNSYKKFLQVP